MTLMERRQSRRISLTRTKSNPQLTAAQQLQLENQLDNPTHLEGWGFRATECYVCGKTNSEAAGLLMQCARCKLAYYCSTKCWKEGSEEHEKYCVQQEEIDRAPSCFQPPEIDLGSREFKQKSIQIKIKTWDGNKQKLEVNLSDTIEDLKRTLAPKVHLPADRQRLLLKGSAAGKKKTLLDEKPAAKSNSNLVAADRTLYDCKLTENCTIYVEPITIPVKVKLPNGKKLKLDVEPSQYITKLQEQIEAAWREQEEGCDDGVVIAASRQALTCDGEKIKATGSSSSSGKKISDYKAIKYGCTIKCDVAKIPIKVKTPNGNKIKLDVDPVETTVDELKELLSKHEDAGGIAAAQQTLTVNDKKLRDGSKKLVDYDIAYGATIKLEPAKIKVKVKLPNGETCKMSVAPTDTLNRLKLLLEEEAGMRAEVMSLTLDGDGGKPLKTGSRTLQDYHIIKDGTTLHLEMTKIPLEIKTSFGSTIKLQVDATTTVDTLKKLIQEQDGMPIHEQKLSYNGTDLDGSKTLEMYGIDGPTTLQLEAQEFAVYCTVPSGRCLKLFVDSDEPITKLQQLIQHNAGLDPEVQVLNYNGKQLELDKDLSDYNVKTGDTIVVTNKNGTKQEEEEPAAPRPAAGRTARRRRSSILQYTPEQVKEQQKKCYMWHGRLNFPSRDKMKELVLDLPESCGISIDDVDLLPWNRGGYALNVHKMNQLFMNPEDQK